jgi:hypothetical protein
MPYQVVTNGKYALKKEYGLYIYAEAFLTESIAVAVRFKGWNVVVRSNIGIVGSNPAQGMDVCLFLFALSCVGSGLATDDPPSKSQITALD